MIVNGKPAHRIRRRRLAGFVPVRIPWSLTIKDRAPAGFSAVLINPSHMYPDLALFIDAAQERLLKAIDGERSVSEILHSAVGTIGDEEGPPVLRAALGARSNRVRREGLALMSDRAGQARPARTTQRKPTWLVDVSIGSACRAAGPVTAAIVRRT